MHSGKDPEGCCHPGAEGPGQTPPSLEAYLQMIGWKLDDSLHESQNPNRLT